VLHGGVGFQVAEDEKGVLRQVTEGCYFMERLAYVCARAADFTVVSGDSPLVWTMAAGRRR
jgi:hypothetical protein